MSPVVLFVAGVLLVYLVANGRARKLWDAATGRADSSQKPSNGPSSPPQGPGDPSDPHYTPWTPPTTA